MLLWLNRPWNTLTVFTYQHLRIYGIVLAKCLRLSDGGWAHPLYGGILSVVVHSVELLVLQFGHLTP